MSRVLVTGGAGFIGSNLIPLLLEKGHNVVVFDNLSSGKLENLKQVSGNPQFKFIQGDIRNRSELHDALVQVDAVVHLAALIDVSASVSDPFSTHEVNVSGTLNVLHEASASGVKKFVFASSTAVYGDVKELPVKEVSTLHPISPYAASKAACEAYLSAFTRCCGIEAVALRFFNVYGPRNENSPYSGVITKFLRKALNGEVLTVEGDGEQTRDFIHVSDIARALALALEREGAGGEVFNVCTGVPTSVNGLANVLGVVTERKLRVLHGPPRVGDIRHSYGDPAKAAKNLGFRSKVNLEQGLKLLLESVEK